MYYDVHCHLLDKAFEKDRELIIKECISKNVSVVETGLDYKSNSECLNLSKSFKNVFCCMGMHPTNPFDNNVINQIINNKDEIIGVGEVGLDFTYPMKEKQQENFAEIIKLANKLKKPLIVHSRGAHEEVVEAVKASKVPVILHAFSASRKNFKKALDNPLIHFSIPPSITYKEEYVFLANNCDVSRLFCETDSPYLWKYERNTPLNVIKAYEAISKIKSLSLNEVETRISGNFNRVFLQ